ncbi:biopolymer transporter ExbD [Alteromonas sp. 1_MG-2023]|uniref:ExbD/TolR family protein n=1 Tax=Alteromonas sp. 1_MG-2023 TaxID=3062669 RepID=UPI0026E36744|nr:biopolymer transporter ExbD [Alteromonas sp. 1_MG-2023]MDO6565571.1 biopolymer transporter ExbD [Alteromonas sp. 1_MG-2023]
MLGKRTRQRKPDAELDITSFLNLMIVLVPVLLMMMVFSRITVVELKLPGLEALGDGANIENQQIELVVTSKGSAIYFPAGYLVQQIPALQQTDSAAKMQDWDNIQFVLKQLKQTLLTKGTQKDDISLMIGDDVDYQTIVTLLERTRSYKDVVAASVVDAALFPDVTFAEMPEDMSHIVWKTDVLSTEGSSAEGAL